MSPHWRFVVGIACLVACRGDAPQKSSSGSGSSQLPPPPPPKVAVSAGEQPTLPVLPDGPPTPGAADAFASQTRDDDWAPVAEREIKKRWKRVRGAALRETECRQSQCKLVVAGSEEDVSQAIADLEGPRGLHGYAKSVLLTAPEKKADGSLELRVFALFDR